MLHHSFTLKDATASWNEFYRKNNLRLAPVTTTPYGTETKDEIKSSRKPVIVGDNEELAAFIRDEKVEQSTQTEQIKRLQEKIDMGKVEVRDFANPEFPFFVMALYVAMKISFHQCINLLEQFQTSLEFKFLKICPLLDEKSETPRLSEDANRLILPQINYSSVGPRIEGEIENVFCQLIATLPPSERFFYVYNYTVFSTIGEQLGFAGTLYYHHGLNVSQNGLFVLSAGAKDALGLSRYGDHYVMTKPCLGIHQPEHIETAINSGFRPGALFYPGTLPFKDKMVHGEKMSFFEGTTHDEYHAMILSKTPLPLRNAIHTLRNTLRSVLEVKNSNEIWNLVDFESYTIRELNSAYLEKAEVESKTATELFCRVLKETTPSSPDKTAYYSLGGYYIMTDGSLSTVGAVLFIDMILDEKRMEKHWSPGLIDPRYLLMPFKKYYQTLKLHWDAIKSETMQKMIFKCQLYFALESVNQQVHFTFLANLIERRDHDLSVTYGKVSLREDSVVKRYKNTLCTIIYGRKLTHNKDFLPLLNTFLLRNDYMAAWLKRTTKPIMRRSCCFWVRRKPLPTTMQALPLAARDPASEEKKLSVTDNLFKAPERYRLGEDKVTPLSLP